MVVGHLERVLEVLEQGVGQRLALVVPDDAQGFDGVAVLLAELLEGRRVVVRLFAREAAVDEGVFARHQRIDEARKQDEQEFARLGMMRDGRHKFLALDVRVVDVVVGRQGFVGEGIVDARGEFLHTYACQTDELLALVVVGLVEDAAQTACEVAQLLIVEVAVAEQLHEARQGERL